MIPTKEKAQKLISNFENLSQKECDCLEYMCTCFKMYRSKAKECALILVDEILSSECADKFREMQHQVYWEEVKQEIQNNN